MGVYDSHVQGLVNVADLTTLTQQLRSSRSNRTHLLYSSETAYLCPQGIDGLVEFVPTAAEAAGQVEVSNLSPTKKGTGTRSPPSRNSSRKSHGPNGQSALQWRTSSRSPSLRRISSLQFQLASRATPLGPMEC